MKEEKCDRDTEIIIGLRQQKEQAILWMLEDYGDLIKSVISYHLRGFPKQEWEECLNEVLFAVWEHHKEFNEQKGTFGSWIAGISKKKAISMARKLWKQKDEIIIGDKASVLLTDFVDLSYNPNDSDAIEEMLSGIKLRDRKLIMEHYLEGYSIEELAKQRDEKPATIYKRLERAKKKIRNQRNGGI